MNFDRTTALVTGAARGIGKAVVHALAAAGARVVIVDIDIDAAQGVADAIGVEGGKAFAVRCDVARYADVSSLATTVLAACGAPDLLINNAFARQVARGTLEDADLDVWKRAFDINVLGNVRVIRAFLQGMTAKGNTHIVDTASSLCILPNADAEAMLPYMASKGAILGVAYALRYSMRRRGIGYSLFCPGLTDTRPGHEQPIAARPTTAAPASFAASVLLAGIQRGEFLISSEPDFASGLVRFAQNQLDPLATQQR